jgi:hypothetical protein
MTSTRPQRATCSGHTTAYDFSDLFFGLAAEQAEAILRSIVVVFDAHDVVLGQITAGLNPY